MVFAAWSGFHAARNIYGEGTHGSKSVSDIFRRQATCQNHRQTETRARLFCQLPVESCAGASQLIRMIGVQQERMRTMERQSGSERIQTIGVLNTARPDQPLARICARISLLFI